MTTTLQRQFSELGKTLAKAQNVAVFRSINRALAKTKTKVHTDAAQKLGVQRKALNARLWQKKANSKNLSAYVNLGIQFGIAYEFFKPKVKFVKGKNKGLKRSTLTVKLPEGRTVLQNAFLFKEKFVLERKGKERKPTRTKRLNIQNMFSDNEQKQFNEFFYAEFERNFESQLQFEISKLK